MSSSPTVRRMVMFKHGVAYLERGGPADGPFELSFKRDEMNDVLKSLAVWVARGDARVGAIAFEKPEDPEAALAARRLLLEPGAALHGLITSLRGRRIAVTSGDTRHEGEVLGIEVETADPPGGRRVLVLRTDDDRISMIDLGPARSIELLEAPSRADLEFLVDRSRAATSGENRTVRVALAGTAEDLRVAYVIPAPVWRVSYRLARSSSGTMLMAWGIVHNPADEDLNDIDLTLTTGQPVSFTIDLYNPKSVKRAVVEEKTRAVAAPTQFERAPMMAAAMPMSAGPPPAPAGFGGGAFGYGGPPLAPGMAPQAQVSRSLSDAMGSAAEGATNYADRGELFEYRVTSKVSLKRGGSAMVPLISATLEARKERIWRSGTGPSPDLLLTFDNGTGAVLEEGAAVFYDEEAYAGEAMVPYSARGVEVKLAYAKDLGVRCKHSRTTHAVATGLRLARDVIAEELRYEEHHVLSAESDHAEAVDVVFEVARNASRSLDPAHAQPLETTESYHRFKVTVSPRARAEIKVVERWADARRIQYDQLSSAQLARWLQSRLMDDAMFEALEGVLALWARAQDIDAQRAAFERDRNESYERQTRISQQLAVLKEGGPEGNLRLRHVKELESAQDQVNHCDAEIRRLRESAEQTRRDAGDQLRKVIEA